ncbi:MAG TPA: putative Na+/H+ antiporter [Chthoniobacter sp.]
MNARAFVVRLGHLLMLLFLIFGATSVATAAAPDGPALFPRSLESYHDAGFTVGEQLAGRVRRDPFNLLATALFLGAIVHTFLASRFMAIAHRHEHALKILGAGEGDDAAREAQARVRDRLRFRAQVFHFMGEIEVVFGLWLVPLAVALALSKGWGAMVEYFGNAQYAEPIFVVVVMAIAASRPVLVLAEACLARVAALGGRTPAAWWFSILTVGPLLGSFITEPAAMTICALLLCRRFYELKPDPVLSYATLGLLFVNISVGGTLTHFAAPPVVMVAKSWNWGLDYMVTHFGWKAVVGILTANVLHFLVFRRRLTSLAAGTAGAPPAAVPVPALVTIVHLLFIAWSVLVSHYPALVVLGFLFFLGYIQATERHQSRIRLRGPLLVGFFLAALVLHGGGQQWWIGPVLGNLSRWPLMIGSTVLTAFNDNAAITYLASLVPGFSESLRYAVVAGAVVGGGLTVIANAPNPAGQSILQSQFGDSGISPLKLFLGALGPTLIVGAALAVLP